MMCAQSKSSELTHSNNTRPTRQARRNSMVLALCVLLACLCANAAPVEAASHTVRNGNPVKNNDVQEIGLDCAARIGHAFNYNASMKNDDLLNPSDCWPFVDDAV